MALFSAYPQRRLWSAQPRGSAPLLPGFVRCQCVFEHVVYVARDLLLAQYGRVSGSAEMLLVYGFFIGHDLSGPLHGHGMRVLTVRVRHYRPYIVLLGRSQHAARAFATSIGVVIG